MKRNRGTAKNYIESSDSEDNRPLKKTPPSSEEKAIRESGSSSESDIENYLSKPEKLDFNSDFFKTKDASEFENIERNMFSGITRLSDSESDNENEEDKHCQKSQSNVDEQAPKFISTDNLQTEMTFKQLQDYTKVIEEAKKFVDKYEARKDAEDNKNDIQQLLALGEKNYESLYNFDPGDLHSSDFDSYESEEEAWKEVKSKPVQETGEKSLIPPKNIQITVSMPETIKKRKGVDLITAMKRRLNRIRKENQVLVHKVHLLCWLGHGNFINTILNESEILAMALSLIPSEQCYPSDRPDLAYLEQITKWYGRTVKLLDKPAPDNITFDTLLRLQIKKKEAFNKKMLACIFVTIMRALGIQCRIVISLQVEPLRPPPNELHSLSQKDQNKPDKKNSSAGTSKSQQVSSLRKQNGKTVEGDEGSCKSKKKVVVSEPVAGTSKSQQASPVLKGNKIYNKNDQSNSKSKKRIHSTELPTVVKKKDLKSETDQLTVPKTARRSNSPKTTNKDDKSPKSKTEKAPKTGQSKTSPKTKKEPTKHTTDQEKSKDKPPPKSRRSKSPTVTSVKESLPIKPKLTISKSPREPKKDTRSRGAKKETIDNNLTIPKSRRRPKSAETTPNLDVKPGTSRSKSSESTEKVTRSTRARKNIPQVDGVWDSDTDEELVIPQLDGISDKKKKTSKPNLKVLKAPAKKTSTIKSDSESDFELPGMSTSKSTRPNLKKLNCKKPKQMDVRKDIVSLIKNRIAEQKHKDRKRLVKKRKPDTQSDSDSDYAPEPVKKKHHDSEDDFVPKVKVKRRVQIPGKIPEEENPVKKKTGIDTWVEVFLEAEEKWISVDVVHGQVHCVKEIYQRASHPVSYIVAWDNNNNLKDITQRYCRNFNTITRKERVDQKWWSESLTPFMGLPTARDKEEDGDFIRQQMDQPLPKSITEYKNHPLYVLKRHLLKFEGLYPPDTPTLGFVRGEAVYPRNCVYLLHSRDIWLKQAKVVKLGEEPYKIVKARPKYDKLSNKIITDQLLEIYGPWQVQDYEPPTAENGIVPRNAFGNVDLFKPCMLPKGTVHLTLQGLNRVARRMNIDCASAIVGFDFHGGWSHPIYDGFVVCQEYEDQLVLAWEIEQDELDRKEQEKIDKRVYGNWKRLIKGLLIREKLKAKYDFGDPKAGTSKEKKNNKTPTFCTKKR